MKIKKENNLIEYIQDLLNRNEMNLSISDILSTIFGNRETMCLQERNNGKEGM